MMGINIPFVLFFFLSFYGWDLESCICVIIINFVLLAIALLHNLFYFLFILVCTLLNPYQPVLVACSRILILLT
ncbi:hypothetical protein VNO77_32460 [Canavalia gladiata]|uniref:Uncharacterized protein n=1 Tax=Canavalia gladiata TaxID=3824 RepID=A0AAN9KRA6_CANGL